MRGTGTKARRDQLAAAGSARGGGISSRRRDQIIAVSVCLVCSQPLLEPVRAVCVLSMHAARRTPHAAQITGGSSCTPAPLGRTHASDGAAPTRTHPAPPAPTRAAHTSVSRAARPGRRPATRRRPPSTLVVAGSPVDRLCTLVQVARPAVLTAVPPPPSQCSAQCPRIGLYTARPCNKRQATSGPCRWRVSLRWLR